MSLLEFIMDTYEMKTCKEVRRTKPGDKDSTEARKHGCPPNMQSHYLSSHQSHSMKSRVIHVFGYQTIANIIGKWLPWHDDADSSDSHHTAMLCHLKPWRKLSMLKGGGQTWMSAYENFIEGLAPHTVAIVGNAQFYY